MKKRGRRLKIAGVGIFMMMLALGGLWVDSLRYTYTISQNTVNFTERGILLTHGHVLFWSEACPQNPAQWNCSRELRDSRYVIELCPLSWRLPWGWTTPDGANFYLHLSWPIELLAAIETAIVFNFRNRHGGRLGELCQDCGYDLRATPDRCPECGAVPETKTGQAA